jgi:hypothetical protein
MRKQYKIIKNDKKCQGYIFEQQQRKDVQGRLVLVWGWHSYWDSKSWVRYQSSVPWLTDTDLKEHFGLQQNYHQFDAKDEAELFMVLL